MTEPPTSPPLTSGIKVVTKTRAPYVPAIGPKLLPLLWLTFAGFALLGATGAYLGGVSFMNWLRTDSLYTTPFTFWMFILHGAVGLFGTLPFLVFGLIHFYSSRHRPNRTAVRLGLIVFALGILVIATGIALFQFEGLPQLPTGSLSRVIIYWAHIVLPVAAVMAYIGHRKAGPRIKWGYGKAWGVIVGVSLIAMAALHSYDPRAGARLASKEGIQYFYPSEARTADGKFIPVEAMMNDEYCMKCHEDIYRDHLHSSHKFSSFNNPAYLFSVKETREVSRKRDGNVKASRWCAGCHDPVPFFSGMFDDPDFDFANHATGHAGITCVTCHSITDVHGPIGNGAYTIEEAQHYPFAYSSNSVLQWINNQMVKAKPEFHKKTFLKPLHKNAEFCSTCHKVALPVALNHYKEFLRGQNHYDSFLLSGVGNGARSFYFPEKAADNCATCHMPLKPSQDFGAKDFDQSGRRTVHNHLFPAANTGLPALLKNDPRYSSRFAEFDRVIQVHSDYLKDKKLRIDLFGVKPFRDDGSIDDDALSVIRPKLPELEPGKTYLIDVVIRTLQLGHHFSQGTVDSNEIWVDFTATANGRVIGRNGATANPDDTGAVDEWSHFLNVHMLDRHGQRIDRRNPQDIFTPLYDKQIPPGAASVAHYRLEVPKDVIGPIEITVRLRYRKFDQKYMEYVHRDLGREIPKLPIVDICSDRVTLPIKGQSTAVPEQQSPITPAWQRWNDYGIAALLEGGVGAKRGNLRQAEHAFAQLLRMDDKSAHWHGHVNRGRVLIELGRLAEAATAINQAGTVNPPAPWWLLAWFSGIITAENAASSADLDRAIEQFEKIVDPKNQPTDRNMNFTRDYVVLARLGQTLFKRSLAEPDGSPEQRQFLDRALARYEQVLAIDPEDLLTHFGLSQVFAKLAISNETDSATDSPNMVASRSLVETLASEVLDANLSTEVRIEKATQLQQAIAALARTPPDPQAPKLTLFMQLRKQFAEEYRGLPDSAFRVEMAGVLATLHRELHAIFKPDELARARATAIYRENHPAANAAAEAIVIYPTNRRGANGLESRLRK